MGLRLCELFLSAALFERALNLLKRVGDLLRLGIGF